MYNTLRNTWSFNSSNTSKLKGITGCYTGRDNASCQKYKESDINGVNPDNCKLTNGKYVCSGKNQRNISYSDIQKCVCNNNGVCTKNDTCVCIPDTAKTKYDPGDSCKAHLIPEAENHYYNMTAEGGTGGCMSESSLISTYGSIDPKIWKKYTSLQLCVADKETQKYKGTVCTPTGNNPNYVYETECVGNDSCNYGQRQDACVVSKVCSDLPWPAGPQANQCPEGMYFTGQWNYAPLGAGAWLGCTPFIEQKCKFCVKGMAGDVSGDCTCPSSCTSDNCCV